MSPKLDSIIGIDHTVIDVSKYALNIISQNVKQLNLTDELYRLDKRNQKMIESKTIMFFFFF